MKRRGRKAFQEGEKESFFHHDQEERSFVFVEGPGREKDS